MTQSTAFKTEWDMLFIGGIGRENGPEGIEQYTQAKSVLPFGYTPE
jgi:hypothetical protein